MGIGSYVSPSSPPPFAAQFAEVTVDSETGAVHVDKLVMAVDSGVIESIDSVGTDRRRDDPSLRLRVCEEMRYDEKGNAIERDLDRYHIAPSQEARGPDPAYRLHITISPYFSPGFSGM